MKLKIVFTWIYEFGRFPDIYEYSTLLAQEGNDVHYVGIHNCEEEKIIDGIKVCHVKNDQSKISVLKKVSQAIDNMNPDVIHTFHYRGCGLLPVLSKLKNKKWILDVRTLHVGKDGSFFLHNMKDRLTHFESFSYNHILALTPQIRKKLLPNKSRINSIPLGGSFSRLNRTDKDELRKKVRTELNYDDNSPVILYAGTFDRGRKIEDVLKAFSLVLKSKKEAKFLLIGGEPSDPYYDEIVDLAKKLSIDKQCRFLERIKYPDVHKYFYASDIGISFLPNNTPYYYQPPTKLIEYMMAGLISVTNESYANNFIVKNMVDGILCENNIDSFTNAIIKAIDLLPNSKEMISKAKEDCLDKDWSNIVKTYLIPYYESLFAHSK